MTRIRKDTCFFFKSKKRELGGRLNNVKDRYLVCIGWNFIKERVVEFKKTLSGRDGDFKTK